MTADPRGTNESGRGPQQTIRAVVGLGSNVGNRLGHLRAAAQRIAKIAHVERASHVYETAPVGGPPQAPFYNAAILVTYDGEPQHLLEALQGVEKILGRTRTAADVRWGPRAIDLDILWIEGLAMESDTLVIPHPRLTERAFALRPLVDVAPDAIDPISQLPYTRLFDEETAKMRPLEVDLFGAS
ncbi:MAG: 2-amino-4-hydroxy-6-hydroxymethyldihydropteridine diphosphokinase [Polyangiaceae bacterium]